MKVAICGSLSFAKEMGELKKRLEEKGFETRLPYTAERILKGEFSKEEIEKKKDDGSFHEFAIKNDGIRRWFDVIKGSDAILIANFDKKGIRNYIGGNAFLEMGFAHILNRKIFLLNPVPEVSYKDEILAMAPVIINGDFSKIA